MPKREPQDATTDTSTGAAGTTNLLTTPIRVINVGLESFAIELASQGVPVTHVQWSPPAGGDAHLAALLGKLGM